MVKERLLKFDGKPLFPERIAYTVPYKLSDDEAQLYKEVTEYVREEFNRAEALQNDKRAGTVGFALTILQRRLASSPEAIAQSLGQTKFIFSSAGIDPRPIDPRTLAFMREKGLDMSRMAPKAIYQVPNLDHYQVIVGVAQEAQQAFPRSPRKMVYIDWSIDDPSRLSGSDAEVRGAYENTFGFLSSHVRDLVGAVLGIRIE